MTDITCLPACGPNVAAALPSNSGQLTPSFTYATVTRLVAVAAGSVAAGAARVSFTNVGTTPATVLGATLGVGRTVDVSAYYDPATNTLNLLPELAYVGSATAILDITVTL